MHADRQTERQTHTHTHTHSDRQVHHNTPYPSQGGLTNIMCYQMLHRNNNKWISATVQAHKAQCSQWTKPHT